MGTKNFSTLSPCANITPTCFSEVPNRASNRKTSHLVPLCVEGKRVQEIVYHYDSCDQEFIGQQRTSNTLSCYCIINKIEDCRPYIYPNDKCNAIFIVILCILVLVVMIGVIMNAMIIVKYLKHSRIRKRISHLLLLNQAIADMANCLIYLTPLIVTHFHNVTYKEHPIILQPLLGFSSILSCGSSILIFLVIAFERYLSIVKPIWHRAPSLESMYVTPDLSGVGNEILGAAAQPLGVKIHLK